MKKKQTDTESLLQLLSLQDHTIAKMDNYEPYTRGHEMDVFVKYSADTDEELIGRVGFVTSF